MDKPMIPLAEVGGITCYQNKGSGSRDVLLKVGHGGTGKGWRQGQIPRLI